MRIACRIPPRFAAGRRVWTVLSRHFHFFPHTLTRVAHWLERGEPGAQKAAPLPWIISALEVLWPMRV